MPDFETDIRALKREWLAARIVIIGGFAIAIAATAYTAFAWRQQILHARAKAEQQIAASQAEQAAMAAFCPAALAQVKAIGLVPPYTGLIAAMPRKTKIAGRYLCAAATPSSRFAVTADYVCKNLKDARCVSLYEITQDGSTVIYKRKD